MYVEIIDEAPFALVREAEDLRALSVRCAGADAALADRGLQAAGLGAVVDGHAWLDPAVLRESARAEIPDADWAGFVAVAERFGWLDELGRIRAHLVDK
jgi:hypothetical protein